MKVVVGLSGGVDSAVTAWLLKNKGYEVIGMTALIFDNADFVEDARRVSEYLDIEYHIVDMRDTFKNKIMDYFVSEYYKGRTPNPCSFCNPFIKWESLFTLLEKTDADYVATGHYARIDKVGERYSIKNSVTAEKDQTYALAFLSQEQLKKTLMPLGEYSKDEVRKMAAEANLPVASKKDSQDICFIPDKDYGAFLKNYTQKEDIKGNFVTKDGKILGQHMGITHYTIGQRKGLNLPMGHPVFVTEIRPEKNEVVIGESEDLFTTKMVLSNMQFMSGAKEELPKRLLCKIRYAHKGEYCTLSFENEKYYVSFENPVRAVTPGQTAVFYDGDYVFSGAVE